MILLLFVGTIYAMSGSSVSDSLKGVSIYFPFDKYGLYKDYMDNAKELRELHNIMNNDSVMRSSDLIIILGSSSPDGDYSYNMRLANRRANTIRTYILREFPQVKSEDIQVYVNNDYWDGLIEAVMQDPNFPHKQEFIQMISNPDLSNNKKSDMMKTMKGGAIITYLRNKGILKALRRGDVSIKFISTELPESERKAYTKLHSLEPLIPSPMVESELRPLVLERPLPIAMKGPASFALRSNLLIDLFAGINIGAELPIGNHISVAADFSYIYTRLFNTYALQSLQFSLEGRYWFRQTSNELTGWNAGLYTTYCSRFDIQWSNGYQGDGYWSAGLSGGYAWRISDSFNIGVAVMGGVVYLPEFRHYTKPQDGHLMWKETRYNAVRFLPTMIRLDLVWLHRPNSGKR